MPAKKKIEEAVQTVEKEVKKTSAAAKRTAKNVADKAAANEIEAKKTASKTARKVKEAVDTKSVTEDLKVKHAIDLVREKANITEAAPKTEEPKAEDAE